MPASFRAIIADDHQIVRDGLRIAFETPGVVEPAGIEVIAEASNGLEALSEVKAHKPELLVLDISMPLSGGAEVITDIKRWSPDTAIVILTGTNAPGLVATLLDNGVNGMFSKGESLDELYKSLPLILRGANFIADSFLKMVESHNTAQLLTDRERQALNMILAGKTSKEIAVLMSVSPKTVDKHRTSLMKKMNVHSIAELMAAALREGLIDPM